MAGTWETQNKVLPGAYINIRTNEPLSVTPGERGTVMILQEMSKGEDKEIYTVTAAKNSFPEGMDADKKFAVEALKNANKALIYKLPDTHTQADVEEALETLRTIKWDVLCYPYDGESESSAKTAVAAFIQDMREKEGMKCQAVLANHAADYEGIINVSQGVILKDNTELTAAEVTAWAAGVTAGAGVTVSNTGKTYEGAVDVKPRMTKTEMETAVQAGQFIFKVDSTQNVSVMYDINSLTTVTAEKGKVFSKNRVIRTLDGIANDISGIFESTYIGKAGNTQSGRTLLKAALTDYLTALQDLGAIQDFSAEDVDILPGTESDAVEVAVSILPVDSVEKLYITVNLS